ncbi:MAG: hypothetical protein TYPL_3450 [Candidatus Tyloplasma litorale]|nr:MAG: hypothetical protein TYPL_3450 [Mycoplasmatales bacterium]
MAFYLLNKKPGLTSNKTLSNFKKGKSFLKIGFSGVLDPFASGLLIVATDSDTKFLELFLNSDKTYIGSILFGTRTNTLDTDGYIVDRIKDFSINKYKLNKMIEKKFVGEILQIPPNYSNIKINGKRAHELSRKNIDFKLKPIKRKINSFKIKELSNIEYKFKINVSSGTYIRSIARDLGDEFSIPSMLTSLRRTSIGKIKSPVFRKFKKIKREKIVPMSFVKIDDLLYKNLIDGKIIDFKREENELVVKNSKGNNMWIKKIENNKYKIKKNID